MVTEMIPKASLSALTDLSSAFESADGLPNSLLIYRAATLIYELTSSSNDIDAHTRIHANPMETQGLKKSFYSLLASVDDDYLGNIILNDLNQGLVGLTENANATLQEMTMTIGMGNRNKPENKQRLEQDLSKCFAAMKAFHTIYAITGADDDRGNDKQRQRCCRLGFNDQVCNQIVFLYDAACQCEASMKLKECILGIIHSWVVLGLIYTSNSKYSNEDDAIQSIMNVIQDISSGQNATCLGDLVVWQENSKIGISMEEAINSSFGNEVHAQKEYLLLMLSSAKTSVKAKKPSNIKKNRSQSKSQSQQRKSSTNQAPQKSGVERLIEQIKQLFPHYGDGYIEAALVCYDHDLERTTSALLEVETDSNSNSVHPRLRALDKKLPSRRKESKSLYNAPAVGKMDLDQDEIEAIEVQKNRMREMEVQEENEAYLMSAAMGEYNDDYDDQYDGIGDDGGAAGGIGAADSGLYDIPDFNAIKAYNKVAKEMESDRLFWEENKNTNRRKGRNGNRDNNKMEGDDNDADGSGRSENGEGGKYRGPDKGKGGRIIGPDGKYLPFPKNRKKGRGGTKQQHGGNEKAAGETNQSSAKKGTDSSAQMTKIQKRRKNDNKAKIANHHRKERAMKKGAM